MTDAYVRAAFRDCVALAEGCAVLDPLEARRRNAFAACAQARSRGGPPTDANPSRHDPVRTSDVCTQRDVTFPAFVASMSTSFQEGSLSRAALSSPLLWPIGIGGCF